MTEVSDDQSSLNSDNICGLNRVKFLCSYGGRILPRPKDGKLRYVGGQTRVLATNRNITFSDLVSKMGEFCGLSVALKCQFPNEDLDNLVSIKSDEELENILEEYDRLGGKKRSIKVRTFLFSRYPSPSKPPLACGHMDHDFEAVSRARASIQSHGYVASSTSSDVYRPA